MKKTLILILLAALGAAWWHQRNNAGGGDGFADEAGASYAAQRGITPDIAFTAIDGRHVDLKELRGKVVLLDFWATWCGPCMTELPKIKAAHARYHARGFEVVGISFDRERAPLERVVRDMALPWAQCYDAESGKNFGQQFKIRSIPAVWLVDKKGVVRFVNGRADMERKIEFLLSEDGPASAVSSGGPAGLLNRAKEVVASVAQRGEPEASSEASPEKKTSGTTSVVEAITGLVSNHPRRSEERPAGLHAVRLKGILASATRPMVMLEAGGRSFSLMVGEEASVTVGGTPLVVRCDGIFEDRVALSASNGVITADLILPQMAGTAPKQP